MPQDLRESVEKKFDEKFSHGVYDGIYSDMRDFSFSIAFPMFIEWIVKMCEESKQFCSRDGGGVCSCHKSPCVGENKHVNIALDTLISRLQEYKTANHI